MDERINEVAWRLFTQRGYARVTMDDLASELGISKKTLYAAIPGKEALLYRLIQMQVERAQAITLDIVNDPELSTYEKLHKLPQFGISVMAQVQPVLFEDIRKLAPAVWQTVEEQRDTLIRDRIGRIVQQGIDKGELSDDIDVDLIHDILYFSLRGVITSSIPITDPVRLVRLIETTILLFYRGLTKGKPT